MTNATGTLVDRIDAILPQTQCTRCGYPACRPYAEAIVLGEAINRCPPGGHAGIARLATLLGRPAVALDPDCGTEVPRRAVRIDASLCIGCTKCIDACPVDAIIGAPKRMHTVIPSLCSGCERCIPVCPMDCMPVSDAPEAWTDADAAAARHRYRLREERLARERIAQTERHLEIGASKLTMLAAEPDDAATQRKREAVAAALARARARLEAQRSGKPA